MLSAVYAPGREATYGHRKDLSPIALGQWGDPDTSDCWKENCPSSLGAWVVGERLVLPADGADTTLSTVCQLAILREWSFNKPIDPTTSEVISGTDNAGFPADVVEFCSRAGVTRDVRQAITLAQQFFPLAGPPSLSLRRDPDSNGEWVNVTIAVPRSMPRGALSDQYDAYTDAWIPADPMNRERIRVSFRRM